MSLNRRNTNPSTKHKQRWRWRAGPHGERGLYSTVVEQRMTVEPLCGGGGGGVLVNSFITTNPHLGRWVYASYSEGKYSVGTNSIRMIRNSKRWHENWNKNMKSTVTIIFETKMKLNDSWCYRRHLLRRGQSFLKSFVSNVPTKRWLAERVLANWNRTYLMSRFVTS